MTNEVGPCARLTGLVPPSTVLILEPAAGEPEPRRAAATPRR